MDPASAALGQRIFDVVWRVVGVGVALLAGAMVLTAVRSMLRGEMAEQKPIWDPRNKAAPVGGIGSWWIVDREGHIDLRGAPLDWPRYQAFRALRNAAEP